MQTAIIFRNIDNGVTTFSTTPNKTSHSVLVVAIPDVLPLHTTHEGHIAVYVGKEAAERSFSNKSRFCRSSTICDMERRKRDIFITA